ncbi:MAG: hypothetical protein Fur0010_28290 [Bdellovibrio sp.]
MHQSRKETLTKLINFSDDLDLIRKDLEKFEWDSEEDLVTITSDSMKNIFKRVKSQEISLEHLQKWGDLVECREDIAYEEKSFQIIKEIITNLANPALYGKCNIEKINNWLNLLVLKKIKYTKFLFFSLLNNSRFPICSHKSKRL